MIDWQYEDYRPSEMLGVLEDIEDHEEMLQLSNMVNWILDKDVIMRQTENAIMGELECLLDNTRPTASANYWLDNKHNVFATISEDSREKWLDIRLELYDADEDWIGDLYIYDTKDMRREELERTVTEIVKDYYGE